MEKEKFEKIIIQLKSNTIKILDLTHEDMSEAEFKRFCETLRVNTSLEKLKLNNLSNIPTWDSYLAWAFKIPNQPGDPTNRTLKELDFTNNDLGEVGLARVLEILINNPKLIKVDVDGCVHGNAASSLEVSRLTEDINTAMKNNQEGKPNTNIGKTTLMKDTKSIYYNLGTFDRLAKLSLASTGMLVASVLLSAAINNTGPKR